MVPLSSFEKMTMVFNRGSLSLFATIFIVRCSTAFKGTYLLRRPIFSLMGSWAKRGFQHSANPGSYPSVLLLRLLSIVAPGSGFLSLNYTLHFPLCLLAFALQANPFFSGSASLWVSFNFISAVT